MNKNSNFEILVPNTCKPFLSIFILNCIYPTARVSRYDTVTGRNMVKRQMIAESTRQKQNCGTYSPDV